MLPSPATTRWSDSAALSEVFLPAHACASIAASNVVAQRLRARVRATAALCQARRAATSFIEPKRRGSLNVTVAPFDMWKTTWSCASCFERSW